MKLCFLKSNALDTLKDGLPRTYKKYFTQSSNAWLSDICGENPFQSFRDVPDFELAPIIRNHEGDTDFNNCKILYRNLSFLIICGGVTNTTAAKNIKTRFFFEATSRTGILRNTLTKQSQARRTENQSAPDDL